MTTAPDSGLLKVDIGICTFQRPALADTLKSIAAVTVPYGVTIRLIVADNDVVSSARDLVAAIQAKIPFQIVYKHCPARNISLARNACLEASEGDFLAFVDDDETVSPQWLVELLWAADRTQADIVLGPVKAVYATSAANWLRAGDFHSTYPVWVKGRIITGYSCNALLRLSSPSIAGRRFDLALGRSGGEDTDFCTNAHAAGAVFAYAPEALVYEPVSASRASFSWLAKRQFRSGQTHGRLLKKGAGPLMLATAKFAVCMSAAALHLPLSVRRNRYALRGILHAGTVSGLSGMREIEQYGRTEATHP